MPGSIATEVMVTGRVEAVAARSNVWRTCFESLSLRLTVPLTVMVPVFHLLAEHNQLGSGRGLCLIHLQPPRIKTEIALFIFVIPPRLPLWLPVLPSLYTKPPAFGPPKWFLRRSISDISAAERLRIPCICVFTPGLPAPLSGGAPPISGRSGRQVLPEAVATIFCSKA